MPTRKIELTEQCEQFIESRVTSGRFSNPSEIVREGLHLLEQREQADTTKREALKSAARPNLEEIERGDYVT